MIKEVKQFLVESRYVIAMMVIMFALALTSAGYILTNDEVVLSDREWECTSAAPHGVNTVCTNYHRKAGNKIQD